MQVWKEMFPFFCHLYQNDPESNLSVFKHLEDVRAITIVHYPISTDTFYTRIKTNDTLYLSSSDMFVACPFVWPLQVYNSAFL